MPALFLDFLEKEYTDNLTSSIQLFIKLVVKNH